MEFETYSENSVVDKSKSSDTCFAKAFHYTFIEVSAGPL